MNKFILISMGLFLVASSAFGLQKLTIQPGVAVNIAISQTKLNEISIQGKRVASVKSKSNKYKMIKDDSQGKLYLQPLGKTPFELFLISQTGKSYLLKLIPTKMEAQTIVLVPEGQKQRAGWEKKASYNSLIAKLLTGLYNDSPVAGFVVESGKKRIPTIKNTKAYQSLVYAGEQALGVVFELKNTSKKDLTLKETQFFSPGVLAIAIERCHLPPNASTRVFLVKEAA